MSDWGGRKVQEARAYMTRFLPCPCARCGKTVSATDAWNLGHIKSRITHPELTWTPSNWQVECRACSDASAQAAVREKAALDGWIAAGRDRADFPGIETAKESPPLPVSLQRPSEALSVPDRLIWDTERLSAYPWLNDLLQVPGDAAVPLAMTPPHPEAVGSYGLEAVDWIERELGIRLRWWQRLAIVRQLEHRADGSLVWRTVVESCPRRAGKSVRIRGLALWRMAHADLIGEIQTVVHCGNDLPICREIQRGAWRWADAQGWTVTRGNGKEAIEADDGSRWLVRSQDGVYGWDAGLAVVDEAWDVKPDTVSEGLEPAMLERLSAQLHLTSTAHRRATSLMKGRISHALAHDDGETLLMLWAAPAGADPGDPETWRAASPHWSDDRARMLASKHAKALAGEVDPEADDLDPMAGFTAQYLNQWVLKAVPTVVGSPVVSEADWQALSAVLPASAPDAVTVEGWPGEGLSVAHAWRQEDRVVVSVTDVPDVASAAALAAAAGCRRPVLVGASLASDPAWRGHRITSTSGAAIRSVADLSRLLSDGVLRHDGSDHLTGQVLALRTSPGADGLRLRSSGRADAVKAAVWAAQEARRKSVGKPRVIVAA